MMPAYKGTTDAEELAAVEGAFILDEIETFLDRFVAYPSEHAKIAHTLWIAHTHLMGSWESTPRIAFLSPEPASGKTRALEITELLVPNAVQAVNVTPSYLFRKVGDQQHMPTILFDEIDTVFGPRAKENEEIRGLLNAGHRRSGVAGRAVSNGRGSVKTEEISAFCPVAMGGLGELPDTILSRSVIIPMRRRAPSETVEPYRRRLYCREGWEIRDKTEKWANKISVAASQAWPVTPQGIDDRDADIWEPMLTVADLAGGDWPKRARVAAVARVAVSKGSTPSLGIRLLADVRQVFMDRDLMGTANLLEELNGLEEAPWSEVQGGRPLNARGLANRLRQYGVHSTDIRIDLWTGKGYRREDLWDAWARYLPSEAFDSPPDTSATSATNATEEAQQMIFDTLGAELIDD
jgi:hypothetical protein